MRLKNNQKLAVLEWVGEGLTEGEIFERAAAFKPPFTITSQMVSRYRKTRDVDLKSIRAISESNALTHGFAKREFRVMALSQLAEVLFGELIGGLIWTDQVKGVGAGPAAEVVDYEEFNSAEIAQFRGLLEDIAAETGGRAKKTELAGPNGEPLPPGQVITLYLPQNNRDKKSK